MHRCLAYYKSVEVLSFTFRLIGNLGFLLYGMKLMSDGIQKSAGERLKKAMSFMTGNRFVAMLTGIAVTMVIQSSGATSVMVILFVNAGLLTLRQAIGVIFGANIGTTITAWIVALFGFGFNIESAAAPLVGIGFLFTVLKRMHAENLGESVMGFGLLFIGLGMMSNTFTVSDATNLEFIVHIQSGGAGTILLGVFAGTILTALLHSSSALTAIVITMAFNKILSWNFSCAMVIGSEVGSTVDAIIASLGAGAASRRVGFVHLFINSVGAALAFIFFHPLLSLVDMMIPGTVESNITFHIAMMHTMFKVIMVVIFLPFVNALAAFAERIIKQSGHSERNEYRLEFMSSSGIKESAAARIIRAEKEIADMTDVVTEMFDRIQRGLQKLDDDFMKNHIPFLQREEDFADQMHVQLCHFILQCRSLPVSEKQLSALSIMLQIVDELELMTDDCLSIGMLLKRSIEKKMRILQEDMDSLVPYMELARQFLQFIHININKHLDESKLSFASELESQIDAFRKNLKKTARKRLESGADVKSELLYIDIVRQIEKIGDRAFSISGLLSQTA